MCGPLGCQAPGQWTNSCSINKIYNYSLLYRKIYTDAFMEVHVCTCICSPMNGKFQLKKKKRDDKKLVAVIFGDFAN